MSINLLASKLRNFESGNLTLAFIEAVNKKGQTVMGKEKEKSVIDSLIHAGCLFQDIST